MNFTLFVYGSVSVKYYKQIATYIIIDYRSMHIYIRYSYTYIIHIYMLACMYICMNFHSKLVMDL